MIVALILASSALAAYEALTRLAHPQRVSDLIAVAAAALMGFAGNELVARYRIRVGRKIGSAALVADGLHARADGFTSLAVLIGAGGVALGWNWADPVVGLVITVAILAVLYQAAREVWRRLMDAVDPALVDRAGHALSATPGVLTSGPSGCAGSATSSGPSARSPSAATSPPSRPTGSPSRPSTVSCTRCPACPRPWCTPTPRRARASTRTRSWHRTASSTPGHRIPGTCPFQLRSRRYRRQVPGIQKGKSVTDSRWSAFA